MNITINNIEYEEISQGDYNRLKREFPATFHSYTARIAHKYYKIFEKYPKVFENSHIKIEVFDFGEIQISFKCESKFIIFSILDLQLLDQAVTLSKKLREIK